MDDTLSQAFSIKLNRNKLLWVVHPHPKYPTISITGAGCDMGCLHCKGRYLEGMVHVKDSRELYSICKKLDSEGAFGVLISGGCNDNGYIPFESFTNSIEKIKKETNLFLSIHSGLMPNSLITRLANAGVDAVDFDLIGDSETIRLVLGIKKKPTDYLETMRNLVSKIPYVSPHICIGLHKGEIRGEWKALEIASKLDISSLVFLVINPTTGTPFEGVNPPDPKIVGELIAKARVDLPDIPISLGCMRPRGSGRSNYEIHALNAGVDRIELPSIETLQVARDMGLELRELNSCCAIPEDILGDFID